MLYLQKASKKIGKYIYPSELSDKATTLQNLLIIMVLYAFF
jgi:hypothetical protein